jgi:hypothetical protein
VLVGHRAFVEVPKRPVVIAASDKLVQRARRVAFVLVVAAETGVKQADVDEVG